MSNTEQALQPETVWQNVSPPKKYGVFLINDDYTPMDFVVSLLTDIFRLPENQAATVMLQVHHKGKGLCGVYQKDIADTKHQQVQNLARQAGHPLLSTVEEV
ncbi:MULTISPECIES: ATP-dependent Clp protease adapter ClpS [Eikenella]|jgi:ATP-dependent clp protease adaptor protein clpS|uniref:ATP-dependent Clp protease adapter protein ClpS n=1 Tax=Eikenella exigua TaxID=2528037 RepID=A0AAX1F7D7_9NEIS|nr:MULTISPECIES: ATP-dependent Clp protease adapter ClpS [Eikenella]OAM28806.1 ATP-dependent Clp protease adaptor ClpS [Eikenella sp. NML01-A-086]OAM41069.1 ATP-dependent Clp protease adaptor ClpS [Eikenella sp. NML97-A-109]QED91974.1 ATP-dependent Clp protease adapter ClpS [Eikenella exigua]